MKVQMVAHIMDPDHGKYVPGDIADLPDEVATDWLNRALCLPYKEGDVETAAGKAPETAAGKPQQAAAAKAETAAKK